jgi:CDP-diacylglycerol--serine O-phosphatidyltransferase
MVEKKSEFTDHRSAANGQGLLSQVPNFFTLLNLIFGCIAITFILQTGETIVLLENGGTTQVNLPEKIWWGALFIFAAALVDFLDGFLARLLKASSEMGKQLDSLSDVVSFGVAPGMVLYQLLRISYAREENGLDVSLLSLIPAFIFPAAAAWRLAKFNLSENQSYHFRGVPSPAAGLLVASLPLIIWYQYFNIQSFFINRWFLYVLILLVSYLMVCDLSFMAIKFRNFSLKENMMKYLLLVLSLVLILWLKWLAVPLIFIVYLFISLLSKKEEPAPLTKV